MRYAKAGMTSEWRVITCGEVGSAAAAASVGLRLLAHEGISLYPTGWDEWNRYPGLPPATVESATNHSSSSWLRS
ncbi:MAG: hypothetical protein KY456_04130 [Chloroflexi bacterium]|nr:hypothetical protein [Chloroflexota bacterium]